MKSTLEIFLTLSIISILNASTYGQKILSEGNVNFCIEGDTIKIKANHVSFAKNIISEDISKIRYTIRKKYILGYNLNERKPIKKHYSLPSNNEVIFEFRKNEIRNVIGADIYVFGRKLGKSIRVLVSKDCLNWLSVGEINDSKQYVNLENKSSIESRFTFLKLVNLNQTDSEVIQVGIIRSNNGKLGKDVEIINNRIESKSKYLYLRVNDFKEFDGDIISVELNGKVIVSRKLLTKWNQFIKIDLEDGKNLLTIKAINEGRKKPNTMNIKLVDGIIINVGSLRLKKNQKRSIEIFVKN